MSNQISIECLIPSIKHYARNYTTVSLFNSNVLNSIVSECIGKDGNYIPSDHIPIMGTVHELLEFIAAIKMSGSTISVAQLNQLVQQYSRNSSPQHEGFGYRSNDLLLSSSLLLCLLLISYFFMNRNKMPQF